MRDDLDIPMPAMGPAAGGGSYRVPRQREGTDPNTKRLAMIAAGIGGTLVVLLGVWSLTSHRRTGVPVVEADARPVREKPVNAGGMQVAGKDEAILSGKADGQAALAPAAEAPAPQALKAQERSAAALPPIPAAAPPAVVASAPPAAVAPARPAPTVAPRIAAPAPAPAVTAQAAPAPAPAAVKPATPAVARPAPVTTAPPAAAQAAKPAAKPGAAQVQLAAVGSEQAAMQEWQRLEKKAPALFGGHKPVVTKTEHDGKTFWRLRTTGFADATAAKGFCDQARGKGVSCVAL